MGYRWATSAKARRDHKPDGRSHYLMLGLSFFCGRSETFSIYRVRHVGRRKRRHDVEIFNVARPETCTAQSCLLTGGFATSTAPLEGACTALCCHSTRLLATMCFSVQPLFPSNPFYPASMPPRPRRPLLFGCLYEP